MFSQSSLDSMSIQELVITVKKMANEVDNRIDLHPQDALDYCNAIITISSHLRDQIEDYVEDVA